MSACVCGYNTISQMARHKRTCRVLQMAELQRKHNEYVKNLLVENEKLKRLLHPDLPEAKAVVDETSYERPKRPKIEKRVAIYVIVYKPTSNIVYVGKTINLDRRFQQHSMYTSQCRLIRDAILEKGKASFEIKALMYCSEADADKNESIMIAKLNTIHPNGLNLRCGNVAGVKEADNVLTKNNFCTDLVEFEEVSEECEATAGAWADVSKMLKHVEDDVEDVCKKWLKRVHPDVTKNASFSAVEVAAIVNNIREAAGKHA